MKALLQRLRTLLVLGRVSNLPTVWTNLIVGWILGEGNPDEFSLLGLLLTGGSLLYICGMYLNDFCDAAFDAQFCPERPIPAGKISRAAVGWLAILFLASGIACLACLGVAPAVTALLLAAAIVLYDCRHKGVAWAPLVMGLCRALLYITGVATASGLETFSHARYFWPQFLFALTMGAYVVGITWFARGESRPQKPTLWAATPLLVPVLVPAVLAIIFPPQIPLSTYLAMPASYYIPKSTCFYSLLFLAWLAWLLVPYWRKKNPSLRRVVSGLLAGIVLADMIAMSQLPEMPPFLLLPFFLLALGLQRFIPAT